MTTKKQNEKIINNLIEQVNQRLNLNDDNKLSLHHENNLPTIDFMKGYERFYQTNDNKSMITYLKGFINGFRFLDTHKNLKK